MALASKLSTSKATCCARPLAASRPAFRAASSSSRRHLHSRPSERAVAVAVAAAEAPADEFAPPEYSSQPQDPSMLDLPAGYHWYETMIVLSSTMTDEDRDRELAKFEAFLNKEECLSINALIKPRVRMAYPIKSQWEGIYVLYTYAAKRQTAVKVQLLLSRPEAGSEDTVLRHITFLKY